MVFLFNYSNLFIDQCASYDSFRYFWKKLLHGKRILRKLEDKSFQSTTSYIWGKEKELKVHAKRIKKQPLFSILRFSINIFFKNLPLSLLKKEKKKKLFAHIFTRNSFRDQHNHRFERNTCTLEHGKNRFDNRWKPWWPPSVVESPINELPVDYPLTLSLSLSIHLSISPSPTSVAR